MPRRAHYIIVQRGIERAFGESAFLHPARQGSEDGVGHAIHVFPAFARIASWWYKIITKKLELRRAETATAPRAGMKCDGFCPSAEATL
jgi:hypothetical protein